MTREEDPELAALMRAAREQARGYADFFGWAPDRDLEESGVLSSLVESMAIEGARFYENIKSRGRPNDPPDCEAIDSNGTRVAIELTELVDGDAIQAYKAGHVYDWAEWPKERFQAKLAELIESKAKRFPKLKDPPYEGGYVVVVHSDEPELTRILVEDYLTDFLISKPQYVTRAILILSYDPHIKRCPYFEVPLNS